MTSHLLKRHVRHADLRAGLDDAVGARAPIEAVADPDPFESDRVNGGQIRRRVWWTYALLAAVLVAYLFSLIRRPAGDTWTWLDGWTIVGLEVVASGLCIAKGVYFKQGRAIAFVLGGALLSWTLGDVVLTTLTLGGATAPTPSLADLFYLGFYPLAYVAVVLLLRTTVGTLSRPNWLDGLIAGMGAAAVCAAFAFHSIVVDAGSSKLATAVNLAYPIGDVILLFLVVGGTTLLGGYKKGPWFLLAGGIALNIVGDTFNLFANSAGSTALGSDFNAIAWPASIVLMSMAVWLRPGPADPFRQPRTAGFFLPGIAAAGVLGLLVVGTQRKVSETALHSRPHAGGRRDPPGPVGARPAHPDRGAPPTGHHRRAHRAWEPAASVPGARHVLRRPARSAAGAHEHWRSSSSTSTTSRRSTTPSGIPPATSSSARSARASRTRRAATNWCSASVATSSASCSSTPMPKRRRTSPSASPPSLDEPSASTR